MANITPEPNYIQIEETRFRAPISEATLTRMGASINFLLDKIPFNVQKIEFLSSTTWIAPQNAIFAIVEGVGGGGGGAGGDAGYFVAGSGGGSGGYAQRFLPVLPNSSYTIQVGQGGVGGTGGNGSPGQASQITGPGVYLWWPGGVQGVRATDVPRLSRAGYIIAHGGRGGIRSLVFPFFSQPGFGGDAFFEFSGGVAGDVLDPGAPGGGGSAGPFGNGGAGGNTNFNGQSAPPNSGAGGGGGSSAQFSGLTVGGNGGSGRIILWLFTKA